MGNDWHGPTGSLHYRSIEDHGQNGVRTQINITVYGQTERDTTAIWNDAPNVIRAMQNARQKYPYLR